MEEQETQDLENKVREKIKLKLEERDYLEGSMLTDMRKGDAVSTVVFKNIYVMSKEINSLRELIGDPLDVEISWSNRKVI